MGDPWRDLNAPEATSEQQLPFFLSNLLKKESISTLNMPKITLRVPLDQPTLTQKKMKFKLAKQVKKEPRKARFPWDIGLLFVHPIKYAMILNNIKFYNNERKSNACDLEVFFKFSCKKTISLKLDLECL